MRILNTSPDQNLDRLRMATIQICMNKPFSQLSTTNKQQAREKQGGKKKKQINVWKSSNLLHKNKQRLHLVRAEKTV